MVFEPGAPARPAFSFHHPTYGAHTGVHSPCSYELTHAQTNEQSGYLQMSTARRVSGALR